MLKSYLTKKELVTAYFTCIRSIIEYCSPVCHHQITKREMAELNKLQRRAHNIICTYNCHCSILGDLSTRRLNSSINLFKKITTETNHPLKHLLYPTSQSGRYLLPHATNNNLIKSLYTSCPWNTIKGDLPIGETCDVVKQDLISLFFRTSP